jgi:hypothetical protein
MANPKLSKLSRTKRLLVFYPNPGNKDNICKEMTLGFPTLSIKILACISRDRYKKIGTICIKDACLQILPAAARGL